MYELKKKTDKNKCLKHITSEWCSLWYFAQRNTLSERPLGVLGAYRKETEDRQDHFTVEQRDLTHSLTLFSQELGFAFLVER